MGSKNAWKAIAIIFIVLFLLETSLLLFGSYLTSQHDKNEQKCIVDICGYNPEAERWEKKYFSYSYNIKSEICYCFNAVGGIAKREYLGN